MWEGAENQLPVLCPVHKLYLCILSVLEFRVFWIYNSRYLYPLILRFFFLKKFPAAHLPSLGYLHKPGNLKCRLSEKMQKYNLNNDRNTIPVSPCHSRCQEYFAFVSFYPILWNLGLLQKYCLGRRTVQTAFPNFLIFPATDLLMKSLSLLFQDFLVLIDFCSFRSDRLLPFFVVGAALCPLLFPQARLIVRYLLFPLLKPSRLLFNFKEPSINLISLKFKAIVNMG